jgi:hypothetical protein
VGVNSIVCLIPRISELRRIIVQLLIKNLKVLEIDKSIDN